MHGNSLPLHPVGITVFAEQYGSAETDLSTGNIRQQMCQTGDRQYPSAPIRIVGPLDKKCVRRAPDMNDLYHAGAESQNLCPTAI